MTSPTSVRLNRFLSMAGVTSRRKADELIAAGRVIVNGRKVADLGTKIDPSSDEVFLDGKQVVVLDEGIYLLLNKPKDAITTVRDERGRTSVLEYVGIDRRVFPVGRLDRNTTGALILTNDGDFAQLLMHPRNKVPKTYLVTADRPVAPADLRRLAAGIRLSDGATAPCDALIVPGTKDRLVQITLREGRNRQVHRMFEAAGYEVRKLDRIAYGPVTCEGLPRGRWRRLRPAEVRALRSAAGQGGEEGAALRPARGPQPDARDNRGSRPRLQKGPVTRSRPAKPARGAAKPSRGRRRSGSPRRKV